jgi:hypothetical protein
MLVSDKMWRAALLSIPFLLGEDLRTIIKSDEVWLTYQQFSFLVFHSTYHFENFLGKARVMRIHKQLTH